MRHPLRVLVVQRTIPPYRIPVFDHLGAVDALEVSVAHSGRPTATPEVHYREIVVPRTRLGSFGYQWGIGRLVAGHDVVIAPLDPHDLGTLARLFRPSRAGYVLWGQGRGRSAALDPVRTGMARRASALLFYGEAGRREYVMRGYDPQKTFVAPNTFHVPHPRFDPAATRSRFLFVGRLQARKRIEELLRAFARIIDRVPVEVGVTIVGSGDKRQRLVALAGALGLAERARFVDETTDERLLAAHFHEALAYVSPGHVGLGVLHSFAHGVPVVTRRRARHGPEFDNIRDGENGLLYDGSLEELGELLVRLARTPTLAVSLGREAHRHYVQKRTLEPMIDGFLRAIRFVAGRRATASLPSPALQAG